MGYPAELYPFRFRRLEADAVVAISETGDHAFLRNEELRALVEYPERLPLDRLAELKSKFFFGDPNARGMLRLLSSRVAAKRETVLSGPALHIVVPTLRCAHSCRYCQVSRALDDEGYSMSVADLNAVCDTIFQSPSKTLTIEFQGGDPLLRFDLVRHAIERISRKNQTEKRDLRFVVASTLHQLDEAMCEFFREHQVYLSTSIDGPRELHNRNRPLPTRDAYERTVAGIQMARALVSPEFVSALMTTTRDSLSHAEEIVDEYVRLGFGDVFIRPLSSHGFAKRNEHSLAYPLANFLRFYEQAFERVLYWNRQGVPIREVLASILLNKILSPFDGGYVDLQSPTGAGVAVVVYNYDGYVYPSDEARMLAETGDTSLRLGRIGESLEALRDGVLQCELVRSSLSRSVPGCRDCAYNSFCGPDPIDAHRQYGTWWVPVHLTEHCQHHTWLFDFLFRKLQMADEWFEDLAYRWARPISTTGAMRDA